MKKLNYFFFFLCCAISLVACKKLEQDEDDTTQPPDQIIDENGGNNGGNTSISVNSTATYWTHDFMIVSVGFTGVNETDIISRGVRIGGNDIASSATGNPFLVNVENLNPGQQYLVHGFIETASGKVYSSGQNITMLSYGITGINADQVGGSSASFTITFEGSVPYVQGLRIGQNADPDPSNGALTFYGTSPNSSSNFYEIDVTGLLPNTTYYVKPFMSALGGFQSVTGPIISITTGAPFNYQLGDSYLGGRIFYIDATGEHGLIAANQNISSAMVFGSVYYSGAGSAYGTGLSNTNTIVATGGTTGTYAALACYNYSVGSNTNWHLPSINELSLLYNNQEYVLGFNGPVYNYWSSTGNSFVSNQSLGINFATGETVTAPINTAWAVRAVQQF
jgi:hypothetical protein